MLFNACIANQRFIHLFRLKKQMSFEILESLYKTTQIYSFHRNCLFSNANEPLFWIFIILLIKIAGLMNLSVDPI